jgi:methionyl-tRNA formyltransferase
VTPSADPGGEPVRTIFFGSGAFAVPILQALVGRRDVVVVGVVTPPDLPSGRRAELTPVPVAAAARASGLPLLQVTRVRVPEAIASIRALRPELGVLADFGQLIPGSIIELPRLGILNVHPSLLPRHRGATPIPATILAGDRVGGVTIMQLDEGLDTGPVIAVRSWALDGTEDAPRLQVRAAAEGASLLTEILPAVLARRTTSQPQDAARATQTRTLRRADGRLDPRRGAADLERQVRAYRPWPGSFIEVRGERLVVHDVAVEPAQPGDQAGSLIADEEGVVLATTDGRLRLLAVQPAGGRRMEIAEFRRGHPDFVGARIDPAGTDPRPDPGSLP